MKLKEVLAIIDSAIVLEIADKKETYDSKSAIPEKRMNYIVKSIKPVENGLCLPSGSNLTGDDFARIFGVLDEVFQ